MFKENENKRKAIYYHILSLFHYSSDVLMVHFSFSPRIQFFFGQILILLALLCLFRCKSYERAKKKLTIEEAPNILTIALKRYQVPSRLSLSSNIYILKVLYEVMNTVLAIEMATTCAIEE